MPGPSNMMDDVATDLAGWIDKTATDVALAFAPGRAPFSANITEDQKLAFYKAQLFNPDGSPNELGRSQEQARLGDEGFARVYKAVLARWPELRPPPAPEIAVPEQWPAAPPAGGPAPPGGPPMPAPMPPGLPGGPPIGPPMPPFPPPSMPPPGPPMPPPMMPVRAMAKGGVVTEPTLALIGEAGPEAVVPLTDGLPPYRPPDPDLNARLGNAPGPDATPPTPSHEEIVAYIRQAAQARGINPDAALAVAMHEGTNPATHRFDSPAERGTFNTGSSWWPYQLHYGGPGYEQYGTTAGLGNDFTARTGIQPGDPTAWRASTDFALDQAIANPKGWAQWYGSGPAKVAPRQGLPPVRR